MSTFFSRICFGFLVGSLLYSSMVSAQIDLTGAIATENYLGLRKAEFYDFRNANLLELNIKGRPSDHVTAVGGIELRNTNFTQVEIIDQLWDRGAVEPIGWRVKDAYVDIYGLFFESTTLTLDVRIGKQIIAWGEADGFNPTNHFDPYNLENPLDFKEHLSNVAMKTSWIISDEALVVEAVVIPRFLPSVLPVSLFLGDDLFSNPLMPSLPPALFQMLQDSGVAIVPPQPEALRLRTPSFLAENAMGGVRMKWSLLGFDWSLSYSHSRVPIPVVSSANTALGSGDQCPEGMDRCLIIREVHLGYPKIDVFGFDFRGGIGDVGIWGEVALFVPQSVDATFSLLNTEMLSVPVVEGEPFTKWVAGAEYTFEGGYFVNLQWIHGFFVENTGHKLHDYLFMVFRKSILSDRLRFEISLGGELGMTNGKNRLGGIVSATVAYKPFDGVELQLGSIMARGEPDAAFSIFEKLDMIYLKIRSDF